MMCGPGVLTVVCNAFDLFTFSVDFSDLGFFGFLIPRWTLSIVSLCFFFGF